MLQNEIKASRLVSIFKVYRSLCYSGVVLEICYSLSVLSSIKCLLRRCFLFFVTFTCQFDALVMYAIKLKTYIYGTQLKGDNCQGKCIFQIVK